MAGEKSKTKLKCGNSGSSFQSQPPPSEKLTRRPKAGETDDDLLKLQRDFFVAKCQPAARVVKAVEKARPSEVSSSTQESHQQQGGVLTSTKRDVVHMDVFPSQASSTKSTHIPPTKKLKADQKSRVATVKPELDQESLATVLSSIIERDTKNASVYPRPFSVDGFPRVVHRGVVNVNNSSQKVTDRTKKSLFAQQFDKSSCTDFKLSSEPCPDSPENTFKSNATLLSSTVSSNMITGFGLSASQASLEAKAIHQENISKISQMDPEKIISEQQMLISTLDEKLINFLKSKKSVKADANSATEKMETDKTVDIGTRQKMSKSETGINKEEIPVQPDPKLVHMDTVELEKLAWMKDLPKPKADSIKGNTARFDFEGCLVPVDADVPVNQGLHHHGEQAERAGYTLEELFHLCRSLNSQQRTLALKTIGQVIINAKSGFFEESLQSLILPSVINAGLVFLLRWALDDKIDNVLVAAIFALHALLTNMKDEESLEFTFCWYRGREVPAHSSVDEASKIPEEKLDFLEKVEETDADKVKEDVVRALVNSMYLLQRLRYLLEMWHPPYQSVNCILEILIRVARNSKQDAYSICKCPRLLDMIINQFLPLSWSTDEHLQDNMKENTMVSAMRLMKAITQTGKSMAADLISRFQLSERIFRYIAQKPSEMNLSIRAAYQLQIASFHTWQVCLAYGLAGEGYSELYPLLMANLQSIVSVPKDSDHILLMSLDSALLGVLEVAMQLAGSHSRIHGKFNPSLKHQQQGTSPVSSPVQLPSPPITWSQVVGLLEPVLLLMQHSLKCVADQFQFNKYSLNLATASVNFVASFFKIWSLQSDYNPLKVLPQLENLCDFLLNFLWPSLGFRSVIIRLTSHSLILNGSKHAKKEITTNLQDLGCKSSAGTSEALPILRMETPYGLLTAILRLFNITCTLHKGLMKKLAPLVATDEDIKGYIKAVTRDYSITSCPFLKFENQFQYYVLKLVSKSGSGYASDPVFHQLALSLATRLYYGDEHLAHTLLSTIIFNKDFLPLDFQLEASIKDFSLLNISEPGEKSSSSSTKGNNLPQQAVSLLNSVRASYMMAFGQRELAMLRSKSRCLAHFEEVQSFLTENLGEALLPCDWMFLPLIEMYSFVNSPQQDGKSIEKLSETQTMKIANALRWIFLLEFKKSKLMTIIPVTLKLSRLMCVFLTGNELFLEPVIHNHLAALLYFYTGTTSLEQMDFEQPIPGLTSFYDFFMSFLQQYEAVSFGDPVFGSYVLLPLQQRHNAMMRKSLWSEHTSVLRTLRVAIKDHLVPIENYLIPEETDTEILRLILLGLLMGTVKPLWAPVMYLVAIHHVNRFLFRQDDQNNGLRRFMFEQISRCPMAQIREHLLLYKLYNAEKEFGMEFYSELPPIRQSLLDKMVGMKTR